MTLLSKLASNPQRSVRIFLWGISLFGCGAASIFLGYYYHHYWQILGLLLLALGIILSAWGYIGIFAQRLVQMFNRNSK